MFIKKYIFSLSIILVAIGFGFAWKWQKKQPEKPYVTIIGPINMCDGVARQTAELANVFLDKFPINIIPTGYVGKRDVPARVLNLLKRKDHALGKVVIFEDVLGKDDFDVESHFKTGKKEDQIRIAYSMFESTRIPAEWTQLLNQYYDAVVVPDPFLIEVYQKSGVTIPIFELPLGLDVKNFLQQPLKKKRHSPMVFANFSACIERKNQLALIQAFVKAFGNRADVLLKLNCRAGTAHTIREVREEILKHRATNILFTQIGHKKEKYLQLFQTVDCYVSLSKGEGFSIQPREAMLLGIPVIATDNTGQSTICKTKLVKTIDSAFAVPAWYPDFGTPMGVWFDCQVDDVATAMLDMYNNYDSYLQKGTEARQWAAQYDFSNKKIHELYLSLVAPKEVVLGSENKLEADCLTTTSQELFQKYTNLRPVHPDSAR